MNIRKTEILSCSSSVTTNTASISPSSSIHYPSVVTSKIPENSSQSLPCKSYTGCKIPTAADFTFGRTPTANRQRKKWRPHQHAHNQDHSNVSSVTATASTFSFVTADTAFKTTKGAFGFQSGLPFSVVETNTIKPGFIPKTASLTNNRTSGFTFGVSSIPTSSSIFSTVSVVACTAPSFSFSIANTESATTKKASGFQFGSPFTSSESNPSKPGFLPSTSVTTNTTSVFPFGVSSIPTTSSMLSTVSSTVFNKTPVTSSTTLVTSSSCTGFQIENFFKDYTLVQSSEIYSVKFLQQALEDLFLSERHSDVTFQVQGQDFRAHWLILAARSPVFSAMYEHDTEEKQTGIVKILDCSSDCFKDFLMFLYTGRIDVVSESNAVSLYRIADKYNVEGLNKKCVCCMIEKLSVESFFDVILLAATYKESELLETATNFFIKNVKTILVSPKWQSFLSENSILGNELLIKLVNRCTFDE